MTLYYAGIGPRETSSAVQEVMTSIATQLAAANWILRSGRARGADQAFERGVKNYKATESNVSCLMNIYLPWMGYEEARPDGFEYGILPISGDQLNIASSHHPRWDLCTTGARKLLCRNVPILLGEDLSTPVECVITSYEPNYTGGTTHAISIANTFRIPVFNLFNDSDRQLLCDFTDERSKTKCHS